MIVSIIVGLLAGWIAGKLMRGQGYGVIADILLGLIGGVVGGWMFGVLGLHAHHAIGALIVATTGATTLVFATRMLTGEI